MRPSKTLLSVSLGFALFSTVVWADFCNGLVQAKIVSNLSKRYQLGVGAVVNLKDETNGTEAVATFLGSSFGLDGHERGYVFYDTAARKIRIFGPSQLIFPDLAKNGAGKAQSTVAPVVRSVNQQGGTCAAYSIYNCFRQLDAMQIKGNGHLAASLADEEARQSLIVRLVNDVYIEKPGITSKVIEAKAKEFGLLLHDVNGPQLTAAVQDNLGKGWPVLIRFDCGKSMCEMPYTLIDHGKENEPTNRLWQPKTGLFSGSAGGHMILLTGIFTGSDGKQWMIAVDPNYQLPRLWPVENLTSPGTANLRAWTIWEKAEAKP